MKQLGRTHKLSWKCKFCGKETDDYYMLNDHLWWKINLSEEEYKKMIAMHPLGGNGIKIFFDIKTPKEIEKKLRGFACLDCVKERIGRDFEITDFPMNIPVNLTNDFIYNEIYIKFTDEDGANFLKENRDALITFATTLSHLEGIYGNVCAREICENLQFGNTSAFDLGAKLFEYRKKHF